MFDGKIILKIGPDLCIWKTIRNFDEAMEISVEHKFKETMASMIENFVSFRNR